ncbi:hypothetical protein Hanom_Chr14g01333741 [Helianthus anomalus]
MVLMVDDGDGLFGLSTTRSSSLLCSFFFTVLVISAPTLRLIFSLTCFAICFAYSLAFSSYLRLFSLLIWSEKR